MKLTWIILFFSINGAIAQGVTNGNGFTAAAYDISGKPINGRTAESILGSQMLNSEWGIGMVRFKNGAIAKEIPLQYNLVTGQLYFLRDKERMLFVDSVQEFFISYKEDGQSQSAFFRMGYPSIGKQDSQSFFEVLQDGTKVQLLKITSKILVETNRYGKGREHEYAKSNQVYLFDVPTKTISKFRKDKSSLKKSIPSANKKLDQLMKGNSMSLRNEEDMIELIKLLNAD